MHIDVEHHPQRRHNEDRSSCAPPRPVFNCAASWLICFPSCLKRLTSNGVAVAGAVQGCFCGSGKSLSGRRFTTGLSPAARDASHSAQEISADDSVCSGLLNVVNNATENQEEKRCLRRTFRAIVLDVGTVENWVPLRCHGVRDVLCDCFKFLVGSNCRKTASLGMKSDELQGLAVPVCPATIRTPG